MNSLQTNQLNTAHVVQSYRLLKSSLFNFYMLIAAFWSQRTDITIFVVF